MVGTALLVAGCSGSSASSTTTTRDVAKDALACEAARAVITRVAQDESQAEYRAALTRLADAAVQVDDRRFAHALDELAIYRPPVVTSKSGSKSTRAALVYRAARSGAIARVCAAVGHELTSCTTTEVPGIDGCIPRSS